MIVRQSWISVPIAKDKIGLPTDLENQSVSSQYPGSGLFRPGGVAETGTSSKMGQRAPGLIFRGYFIGKDWTQES